MADFPILLYIYGKELTLKLIPSSNDPKPKKLQKNGIRRLLILIANTLGFATLYYVLPEFGFFYLPHIYLACGGGLALWYVIYNRGFNTHGKTADMLPDSLPLEERERLIAEGARRFDKTRWVLLILLPLLLVFLFDTVYLFLIPEGLFS